jgi:hypothetical protein
MINSVWILSAGRSGSTLLDRLIGTHPTALSVGELWKLPRDISLHQICSCGAPIDSCSFWAPAISELSKRLKVDLWSNPYALNLGFARAEVQIDTSRQTKSYLVRRALHHLWIEAGSALRLDLQKSLWFAAHRESVARIDALHEFLRSYANRSLIVDSTKAFRVSVTHHAMHPDRVRLILYSRDGRGVMASNMRSGSNREEAVRAWSRYYERALPWIERHVAERDVIRVYYEELVSNPQKELRRIFEFLGVSMPDGALHPDAGHHHILSGNPMRMGPIGEVRLDERWRRELSAADLSYFNSAAGATSRKLGYV